MQEGITLYAEYGDKKYIINAISDRIIIITATTGLVKSSTEVYKKII